LAINHRELPLALLGKIGEVSSIGAQYQCADGVILWAGLAVHDYAMLGPLL
jgi:hypothetical protein